jgi:uncharacterized protein YkwD
MRSLTISLRVKVRRQGILRACYPLTLETVLTIPLATRRLRWLAPAIALAAIVLSLALTTGRTAAEPELDTQESRFLELLNDYRAENGKPALIANPILNAAADWYATDMAVNNYYGHAQYCFENFGVNQAHCDSLGRWPGARVKAFGYPQGVGENSAAGFSTADAVFAAWRNSPGHNANMLGGYLVIGIGWKCQQGSYYGCYWVTDFGYSNAQPSITPVPTPPPTPTPSPTPTDAATPTPAGPALPAGLAWHDLNCDGVLTSADGIVVLLSEFGSSSQGASCPALGQRFFHNGDRYRWGDVDCSGRVDSMDSIQLLAHLADLPIQKHLAACPTPGTYS